MANPKPVVYNGKTFKSLPELCKKLNIKCNTIRSRMYQKGISVEEAVNYISSMAITYKNKTYSSTRDLCEKLNLDYSAVLRLKQKKMSLEEAIETLTKRLILYENKTYQSVKELCKDNNLNYNRILRKMRKQKMSLEEAIEASLQKYAQPLKYNNETFYSLAELLRKYNPHKFAYNTVYNRLMNGMTVKEALETSHEVAPKNFNKIKIAYIHNNTNYYECIHNNQKYILSIPEMKALSERKKENEQINTYDLQK